MPFLARLLHILRTSGPAPDNEWAVRLVSSPGWKRAFALRYLRLRFSPDVLPQICALTVPLAEKGRLFSAAISQVNVHETYKTTGLGRTRLADEAILRHCAMLEGVRLMDVGASDGVASLGLLERLPNLRDVVLADRHDEFYARGPRTLRIFLAGDRRFLGVKILGLYLNLSLEHSVDSSKFQPIATLNPILMQRQNGLRLVRFDAAHDVLRPPATVVKCANLLNRGYFPGLTLRAVAANLGRSVVEGGFLCISQNDPQYPDGEAYIMFQRRGQALELVEERGGHEALEALEPMPIALPGNG